MEPLLALRSIGKRFGPVVALEGVDLSIGRAEAVGLIGDNGAGKSTLVKVLSGVFTPSTGEVLLDGRSVAFGSPIDARRSGIEMIYQDLALCGALDVAANIFLGREIRRGWGPFRLLDRVAMAAEADRIMRELGSDIESSRVVDTLSGGERQLVAVGRALQFQPRLLLLDEPTAALSNDKVRILLSLIRQLKERGVAILLISHRFADIVQVCDRVIVLKHGRIAGELAPADEPLDRTMAAMELLMTGDGVAVA